MTDQTIDVGEIRPVAAAWPPEESRPESRVSPPPLGWDVFGTPADTPAPPVAVVSVGTPRLLADAQASWMVEVSGLAARARVAVRRHESDIWVLVEFFAVAVAGLVTVSLLDAFGAASWVALCAVMCVVVQTKPQLVATAPLEVFPVLRSLAVAFAATAMLAALGLTSVEALRSATWVVAVTGAVILSVLLLRRSMRRPARAVVVGDRAAISRAAMQWSDGSVHVIGGVLPGAEETHLQSIVGVPTIAGLEHAADWARGRRADLVLMSPGHDLTGPQARQLAWSLERSGIRLAVTDLVSDAAPHRVRVTRFGRSTVVELAPTRRSTLFRALKGLVDRAVGSLLLLCAAPFLATMLVLIRLDSPGAALFEQIRVGRDGKPFTMYKLRTMHVDAERRLATLREQNEGAGLLFKMHDDPRVTRVGRLLRRTSMDELPQLINVVLGQMSLVGPRPALPYEVAEYDEVECRRLAVKPGMTGLWQVSGRSNLDWETSIGLDLHYVDNWRLADDIVIGLRTVGAVMGARGAY
jgi:exopolysaccharide biosynthesis polyprenyl glycosylphosphotransferase